MPARMQPGGRIVFAYPNAWSRRLSTTSARGIQPSSPGLIRWGLKWPLPMFRGFGGKVVRTTLPVTKLEAALTG